MKFIGEREIGRFRPRAWDLRREQRELAQEEQRQAVRRLAMTQATLTFRRQYIARKFYNDEAINFDDWPALALLTATERTRIIADVRHLLGFETKECACPNRKDGIHYGDCETKRRRKP